MIAGGVESMTRAPFVHGQGRLGLLARREDLRHDDRLAFRQSADEGEVRHRLDARDGGERRRASSRSSRADQDAFALRSQERAGGGDRSGPARGGDRAGDDPARRRATRSSFRQDEHPRETTLEALAKLKGIVRPDGTVTAGNASGVNDGAAAVLIASGRRREALRPDAARAHRRRAPWPASRRASWASARRPATRKVLAQAGLTHRRHRRHRAERGLRRAGARRHARPRACPTTRARQPERRRDRARPSARRQRRAPRHHRAVRAAAHAAAATRLATMCIGVGQGIAVVIERV